MATNATEKEAEAKQESCNTTQNSCSTEQQKNEAAKVQQAEQQKTQEKSKHGGCCGG